LSESNNPAAQETAINASATNRSSKAITDAFCLVIALSFLTAWPGCVLFLKATAKACVSLPVE
jgi:hypothetical protein